MDLWARIVKGVKRCLPFTYGQERLHQQVQNRRIRQDQRQQNQKLDELSLRVDDLNSQSQRQHAQELSQSSAQELQYREQAPEEQLRAPQQFVGVGERLAGVEEGLAGLQQGVFGLQQGVFGLQQSADVLGETVGGLTGELQGLGARIDEVALNQQQSMAAAAFDSKAAKAQALAKGPLSLENAQAAAISHLPSGHPAWETFERQDKRLGEAVQGDSLIISTAQAAGEVFVSGMEAQANLTQFLAGVLPAVEAVEETTFSSAAGPTSSPSVAGPAPSSSSSSSSSTGSSPTGSSGFNHPVASMSFQVYSTKDSNKSMVLDNLKEIGDCLPAVQIAEASACTVEIALSERISPTHTALPIHVTSPPSLAPFKGLKTGPSSLDILFLWTLGALGFLSLIFSNKDVKKIILNKKGLLKWKNMN